MYIHDVKIYILIWIYEVDKNSNGLGLNWTLMLMVKTE